MKHLLTLEELKSLGRPIGKVDNDKLTAYLTETEQMHIKPKLGDELYLRLLEDEITDEPLLLLLSGGTYTDENGKMYSFMGLKQAISYYVFAQNIMSGDLQSTRYGNVFKDGDYSSRPSSKERSDHYNNTLEVANFYLNECVSYCLRTKLIASRKTTPSSIGGITIRKIGK